eukprot:1506576-Amphidinium_carterae.1
MTLLTCVVKMPWVFELDLRRFAVLRAALKDTLSAGSFDTVILFKSRLPFASHNASWRSQSGSFSGRLLP